MSKYESEKKKKKSSQAGKGMPKMAPFVSSGAGLAASGVRVGFPANRTVNLVYCDTFDVSSAYGAQGLFQFAINDAYDPNYTSTGHQPMGFDQWALFYNHYVVETCAYELSVVTADTSTPMTYVVQLSDDQTIPTTTSTLIELGGQPELYAPGTPPHIFRGEVNFSKFFNRGSSIAVDDALRAPVTTSPTERCFLSFCTYAVNSALASVSSRAIIKLTMRVRFMEPKDLAPSALRSSPCVQHPAPPSSIEEKDGDFIVVGGARFKRA
jgi:hypothetical protein